MWKGLQTTHSHSRFIIKRTPAICHQRSILFIKADELHGRRNDFVNLAELQEAIRSHIEAKSSDLRMRYSQKQSAPSDHCWIYR